MFPKQNRNVVHFTRKSYPNKFKILSKLYEPIGRTIDLTRIPRKLYPRYPISDSLETLSKLSEYNKSIIHILRTTLSENSGIFIHFIRILWMFYPHHSNTGNYPRYPNTVEALSTLFEHC